VSQFREKLNERYVTTHFSKLRTLTPDEFESYARFYRVAFTPHLPPDRQARILEVGCGLGQFLYFLKQEEYVNHWGIDIGREQVDSCRRSVTDQVEWVDDTRAYLAQRTGYYSAIVFIDVLEHIEDEDLFPLLEAARGALTDTGKIIISVPNAACITSLTTLYGDLTHKRLFTEGSLSQLLLAAGFSNVQIAPHEKKVIRSFRSRRQKWLWRLRERLVRWLLSEFHQHLMEGSYPQVQTISLLAVAQKFLET